MAKRLRGEGNQVRVFDNLSSGKTSNLDAELDLVTGDVRSGADLGRAMRGVDAVLHLAAMTSVARSWKEPVDVLDVNTQGTVNVVEAARAAGVSVLIYSSSSSVYGNQPARRKSEELPARPISPYGHSKLMGEQYALLRAGAGMRVLALRYFNVFGPGQDPDSPYAAVIPRFLRHASEGTKAVIDGDGRQSRDFTYVENAVHANLLALRSDASGLALNVACGKAYTLLDVVHRIELVCGCSLRKEHGPARPGDIRHSLADLGRVERTIGYRPVVNFQEGILRTYDAYRRP